LRLLACSRGSSMRHPLSDTRATEPVCFITLSVLCVALRRGWRVVVASSRSRASMGRAPHLFSYAFLCRGFSETLHDRLVRQGSQG
jgi:hypothetical protein